MVQLNGKADALVIVEPALLDRAIRFLLSTYDGRLPIDLFDSAAMRSWIGKVVNERGHAFNKTVQSIFKNAGFQAREVNVTELGGPAELGDVDAFAWSTESGLVYAAECKKVDVRAHRW